MNIEKLTPAELSGRLAHSDCAFVCSSSFEKRCLSVAQALDPASVKKAYILEARDLSDYVGQSALLLKERFAPNSEIVQVSTQDPLSTGDSIAEMVRVMIERAPSDRWLIDITTFTHEALLILLRLLRINSDACREKSIRFAYTNSADYSIGDPVESKWLSKGVQGVRTVLGYPGRLLPSRRTHLIILVGYEYERAVKLIELMDPTSVSLGFGRSGTATSEKNKDANEHYLRLVERMAAAYTTVDTFEIACNDPLQTRALIAEKAAKTQGLNVVLAPMNNKMSTLGAALAAFEREDIQVCYCPVNEYNFQSYSAPGDACYLIDLPEILDTDASS